MCFLDEETFGSNLCPEFVIFHTLYDIRTTKMRTSACELYFEYIRKCLFWENKMNYMGDTKQVKTKLPFTCMHMCTLYVCD